MHEKQAKKPSVKKQASLTAATRKSQDAELIDGKKAWAGKRSGIVLLKSGLLPDSLEELKAFGKETGVRVVDEWTPNVTHVVCGIYGDLPMKCAFSREDCLAVCSANSWFLPAFH